MSKAKRWIAVLGTILILGIAAGALGVLPFTERERARADEKLWTEVEGLSLPEQTDGVYVVDTPEAFAAFVKAYNEGTGEVEETATIRLSASLDFSDHIYVPLGTATRPFKGTLSGNGFAMSGITYPADCDSAAIAGYLDARGTISQLAYRGGLFVREPESGSSAIQYAAGIAGNNAGTINECIVLLEREQTNVAPSARASVGGIVGKNERGGKITNVAVGGILGAITGSGVRFGGIAGENEGVIAYGYAVERASEAFESDSLYAHGRLIGSNGGSGFYLYYTADALREDAEAIGGEGSGSATQCESIEESALQEKVSPSTALFPRSEEVNAALEVSRVTRNWTYATFTDNGTSFYAPVLPIFLTSASEQMRETARMRRFGFSTTSSAEWGSEENPYLIESEAQFRIFAENVGASNSYVGAVFSLTKNLDFGRETLTQVGGYRLTQGDRPFSGVFDGGGNAIRNFRLDRSAEGYVGLFGYLATSGEIRNLTLSSAEVQGANFVGGLVGQCEGAVRNVHVGSDVQVRGNSYLGGVIGNLNGGRLYTVLSEAAPSPRSISATAMRGIAGQSANETTSNVWFVTTTDAEVRDAGCGTVLEVDRNGTVAANMTPQTNGSYEISFEATPEGSRNTSFRTEGESEIGGSSNRLVGSDYAVSGGRVYVRFTTPFAVKVNGENADAMGSFATLNLTEAECYEGQTLLLYVEPETGYYVDDAILTDGGTEGAAQISYLEEGSNRVTLSVVVGKNTEGINVSVKDFGAASVVAQNFPQREEEIQKILPDYSADEKIIYNGEAVTYVYENPDETKFRVNYTWDTASAPSKAGSHYVNIRLTSLEGGFRGQAREIFTIYPRPLEVPDEALERTKPFDGQGNKAVPAAVDKTKVKCLLEKDIGSVGIGALATYLQTMPGDASANFTFTLTEAGGNKNYELRESVKNGVGTTITKKEIVYDIGRRGEIFESVYNAGQPRIETHGPIDNAHAAVTGYEISLSFTFIAVETDGEGKPLFDEDGTPLRKEGVVPGSAGLYWVDYTVIMRGDASYETYYEFKTRKEYLIEQKDPSAPETPYYFYTILPKPVTLVLTGTENLKYTGEDLSSGIGAYYESAKANGGRVYLSGSECKFEYEQEGVWVVADKVENAGKYRLAATLSDSNYCVEEGSYPEFSVGKKEQAELKLSFASEQDAWYYGDTARFSVTGGEGAGAIALEVVEGAENVEILSDGLSLLFRAGDIGVKVRAISQGGQNYETAYSDEIVIPVLKKALTVAFSSDEYEFIYGEEIRPACDFEGFTEADAAEYASDPANLFERLHFVLPGLLVDGTPYEGESRYHVGVYTLTLATAGSSSGYSIALAEGGKTTATMQIGKRGVTVLPARTTQIYGDDEAQIGFTAMGEDGKDYAAELSGSLGRETGRNAGNYKINAGSVTNENNSDFEIEFSETAVYYVIEARTLTVRMKKMQKEFGEEDSAYPYDVENLASEDEGRLAEILSGAPGREGGEDAGNYDYNRGDLKLLDEQNYRLDFVTTDESGNPVFFVILARAPHLQAERNLRVRYDTDFSTLRPVVGVAFGAEGERVAGHFDWKTPLETPDFTNTDTVTAIAVFYSEDSNYRGGGELTVTLEIEKIVLDVTISGGLRYVYNGRRQGSLTYEATGQVEGFDPLLEADFEGGVQPVDAGSYPYEVRALSHYYRIEGRSRVVLEIVKAELRVGLSDTSHLAGVTPSVNFTYRGFMPGEGEEELDELPKVDWHQIPGSYTVTPYGASARNYQIVYASAHETVYQAEVSTGDGAVLWEGRWSYDTQLAIEALSTEDKDYADILNKWLAMRTGDYAGSIPTLVYQVTVTGVGEGAELRVLLAEGVSFEAPKVFVLRADGTSALVDARVEEGYLVFEAGADVVYFAAVDPAPLAPFDWQKLIIPIGIGAGALIVVAVLLGVVAAKRRRLEDSILGRRRSKR